MSIKPREVTKAEADTYLRAYPNELRKDICGIFEPPCVTYNDFTKGDWPKSVVVSVSLDSDYGMPDRYFIHDSKDTGGPDVH